MRAAERISPLPFEVVWKPIPGTSQEIAIDSRANHTLFHGARGPGKTITQLMKYRRRVGMGYGSFWRGIIFDKEYKNLSDLIAQSQRFFTKFKDGAKFLSAASDLKWVWPTGEELLFRHVKKLSDYDNFHGHEYPFMGWNELTKHANGDLYHKMMSCNRSSYVPEVHGYIGGKMLGHNGGPALDDSDMPNVPVGPNGEIPPPIPLEVFSTTNPSGPGHNWVKREFIDASPIPGKVIKTEIEVENPNTGITQKIVTTKVAIFGNAFENIYQSPQYLANLASIKNKNLREAWLYGNWDVVAGGAFDDLWDRSVHVVPRFKVPLNWRVDRCFDWGSSHPFSVGWFAEANGEEVQLPDGRIWAPVAGSIIQIAEWYGTEEIGTNKGLKLSSTAIAEGIRDREIKMMEMGWFLKQPFAGPADNQIRNVTEVDNETIEKKMLEIGIAWTNSDKSPGSRVNGVQLFRDRLQASSEGEGPGYYVTENCTATISILPVLAVDEDNPDDVDKEQEEHPWDMTRYRILKDARKPIAKLDIHFAR